MGESAGAHEQGGPPADPPPPPPSAASADEQSSSVGDKATSGDTASPPSPETTAGIANKPVVAGGSGSKGKGGSAQKRAGKAAAKGGGASSSKKKSAEKMEKDEQKRCKWTMCQVQKLVDLIVEHVPAGNMGWQAVSDSFNEIGANENWRERDVDSLRSKWQKLKTAELRKGKPTGSAQMPELRKAILKAHDQLESKYAMMELSGGSDDSSSDEDLMAWDAPDNAPHVVVKKEKGVDDDAEADKNDISEDERLARDDDGGLTEDHPALEDPAVQEMDRRLGGAKDDEDEDFETGVEKFSKRKLGKASVSRLKRAATESAVARAQHGVGGQRAGTRELLATASQLTSAVQTTAASSSSVGEMNNIFAMMQAQSMNDREEREERYRREREEREERERQRERDRRDQREEARNNMMMMLALLRGSGSLPTSPASSTATAESASDAEYKSSSSKEY